MSSISFPFEKTNKPTLMICGAVHDDSDDHISLKPEQNDLKCYGLLASFLEVAIRKKTPIIFRLIFFPLLVYHLDGRMRLRSP